MSSSRNRLTGHHFLWLLGWTALATALAIALLPATAAADCASDKGCYCGDGNCPTLGCCGGDGQRPCVTNPPFSTSDCRTVCNPGYHLDVLTSSCQPPCPSRDDGSCFTLGPCGRAGERACAIGASCDPGACRDVATLGSTCRACSSRDDGLYFAFGPCGKSYERICALVPACDEGYSFDSGYTSYIGTFACQPDWRPGPSVPSQGFDFTFFVVTDLHIGEPERSECSPESAYDDMTRFVNEVGSSGLVWPPGYEREGLPIGDPIAVVSTGDNTVHGADSFEASLRTEFTKFRDFWDERRHHDTRGPSVNFTVYPGLGNHDLVSCDLDAHPMETLVSVLATFDPWGAAVVDRVLLQQLIDDTLCLFRAVTKNNISNGYMDLRMRDAEGVSFDDATKNYSWDWGPMHFVQGNLWAGRFDSLDWLRDDLARNVGGTGRPVVLFQHYGWEPFSVGRRCQGGSKADDLCADASNCDGSACVIKPSTEWWSQSDRQALKAALAGYNVAGIFVGHSHDSLYIPASDKVVGPGYDVFQGEDGGQDDNCDDDLKAGRTPQGDGGILVVRFADKGNGAAKMEVLQLLWDAGTMTSASQMTASPKMPTFSQSVRLRGAPPTMQCRDVAVAADGACRATASVDNGSFDPEGGTLTCTRTPGGPYALGATSVDFTCADPDGQSGTCHGVVTVTDRTDPAIACPASRTLECAADRRAPANYAATASDNCTAAPTITCDRPSGSSFLLGTTPVSCTATDDAGNDASCGFDVTVVDTTRPDITCPGPIQQECTSTAGAAVSFAATSSDTCWGTLAAACPRSGSAFPLGLTPVECSATDGSGNASSCASTVRVVDTTRPTITCPAPIQQECTSPAGAPVSFAATSSDICWGTLAAACPRSGSTFALGLTPVECSATDGSGNASSCGSTVRVVDTTAPVIDRVTSAPGSLWPPNHKMVGVSLDVVARDVCDTTPQCAISAISGNDGAGPDDWQITGPLRANLRSERTGGGDGRVYTLTVRCRDHEGNASTAQTTVVVPHNP